MIIYSEGFPAHAARVYIPFLTEMLFLKNQANPLHSGFSLHGNNTLYLFLPIYAMFSRKKCMQTSEYMSLALDVGKPSPVSPGS